MFDSVDELLTKIRMGEDSLLELKAVRFQGERVVGPSRDDLADELAAMANAAGGVVLFGVDDKSLEIEGIALERLSTVETYVREICNDSIKPPIDLIALKLQLPDTLGELRYVLKVEIPRSLFVHESPHGYFRRQGSSKRKLPPEQLARLFQQRSQARILRFEEQAVPGAAFSDLSPALWRRFLPQGAEDPQGILRKMKLLTREDSTEEAPSVAGVLLCSEHPETWLPGAIIEAVRYRGVRQDSNYQLDAATVTGSLDAQIRQALAFALRNMSIAATKEPDRREIPQYSERALFEAIVNAVAHRDYSIHGSKIRLFLFDDRLELYSPGALPNSLTVDSLSLRQATRNELITFLLARVPSEGVRGGQGHLAFMERRGDGVPIIFEQSRLLSGRTPDYLLIDEAELRLTIYAAKLPVEEDGGSS